MKLLVRLILSTVITLSAVVLPVSSVPALASCSPSDGYGSVICADNPYYFFRFMPTTGSGSGTIQADQAGHAGFTENMWTSGAGTFSSSNGPNGSVDGFGAGQWTSMYDAGDGSGVTTHFTTPQWSTVTASTDWTMEGWFYEKSTQFGNTTAANCSGASSPYNDLEIVSNTGSNWGANAGQFWLVIYGCNGTYGPPGMPSIWYDDTGGTLHQFTASSISRDQWHLMDLVMTNGGTSIKAYIDGAQISTTQTAVSSTLTNNIWEFGGNFSGAGSCCGGTFVEFSEWAFYQHALTASQISNHYTTSGSLACFGSSCTGPQVTISGHACVRALVLDNGSACNTGDIAATRAVIGFSSFSTSNAATLVCGRTSCATTDGSGYYTYSLSIPTNSSLYWIFQGSGWCSGCAGNFRFNPSGGYQLTSVTQSSSTSGNDFVIDANLYRGTNQYNNYTNYSVLGFVTTSATGQALSNLGYTLTPAQEAALQTAENSFAAARGVAAQTVDTGFGRLFSAALGGAVIPITVVTTLVMNPSTTANAELWFPDTGARIQLAPQATTTITINPTTEPSGVVATQGEAVAVDTTPGTAPTPLYTPTTLGTPVPVTTVTTTQTTTLVQDTPGSTDCGSLVFILWQGLGPLMQCLFQPTEQVTDILTVTDPVTGGQEDIPTAIQTKIGFADFYELKDFICANSDPSNANTPCNISGGLFGWFQGTQWSGYIPWYDRNTGTVSNTIVTWTVLASDPLPTLFRSIVTLGILVFAIGGIGSAIMAFFGMGGDQIEPLTEDQGSTFGEDTVDAPNHSWPEG